jgi:hypothetical protein
MGAGGDLPCGSLVLRLSTKARGEITVSSGGKGVADGSETSEQWRIYRSLVWRLLA